MLTKSWFGCSFQSLIMRISYIRYGQKLRLFFLSAQGQNIFSNWAESEQTFKVFERVLFGTSLFRFHSTAEILFCTNNKFSLYFCQNQYEIPIIPLKIHKNLKWAKSLTYGRHNKKRNKFLLKWNYFHPNLWHHSSTVSVGHVVTHKHH